MNSDNNKTMNHFSGIFVCAIAIGLVAGCQQTSANKSTVKATASKASPSLKDELFGGAKVKSKKQMTVKVAARETNCFGAYGAMKCLSVTFSDGRVEKLTEGIHGYTHVNGKAATLLVERITYDTSSVPNSLPQDISSVQYKLIRVK